MHGRERLHIQLHPLDLFARLRIAGSLRRTRRLVGVEQVGLESDPLGGQYAISIPATCASGCTYYTCRIRLLSVMT